MKPIGFSTGALAKGDFATALDVQRHVPRIDVVELSALRDHELPDLVEAIPNLDLEQFEYVSFHGEHRPLGATTRQAFARIVHLIPADCPLIIESIIPPALIEHELDAVSAVFDAATRQAAIA